MCKWQKAYGVDLKTMLSAYGYTEAKFDAEVQAYGESRAKQEIVIKAIIAAEKLELSEE